MRVDLPAAVAPLSLLDGQADWFGSGTGPPPPSPLAALSPSGASRDAFDVGRLHLLSTQFQRKADGDLFKGSYPLG